VEGAGLVELDFLFCAGLDDQRSREGPADTFAVRIHGEISLVANSEVTRKGRAVVGNASFGISPLTRERPPGRVALCRVGKFNLGGAKLTVLQRHGRKVPGHRYLVREFFDCLVLGACWWEVSCGCWLRCSLHAG